MLAAIVLREKFDRERQEKQLLRQKLERLLLLAYALRTLAEEINSLALGTTDSDDLDYSPVGEIRTISSLYFGSLQPHVSRVLAAYHSYNVFAFEFQTDRLRNETTFDIASFPGKVKKPYQELLDQINNLEKEAQSLAKEFT